MRPDLTALWQRMRPLVLLAAAAVAAVGFDVPVQAEDPLDPHLGDPGQVFPNLVPSVADVRIENFRLTETTVDGITLTTQENGLFLKFDTRAQNLGTVPVQLTVDEVEDAEHSTVSQCVSWRLPEAHICRDTELIGGFTWHEEHSHFHFEDFAAYQLRRLTSGGRPDYSNAGLIRVADKVSFCLVDSEQVRQEARPTRFYLTCLPTVQGITPGWTDVYTYDMVGQNFPIHDIPDGDYALIVDLDYGNVIRENDDTDNYVEVTVRISENRSKVEILRRNWPRPDDRGTDTTTTTTKKKPHPANGSVGGNGNHFGTR